MNQENQDYQPNQPENQFSQPGEQPAQPSTHFQAPQTTSETFPQTSPLQEAPEPVQMSPDTPQAPQFTQQEEAPVAPAQSPAPTPDQFPPQPERPATLFSPAQDTAAPHKKSKHGLVIILSVLSVIVLALLGVVAYLAFFQPKPAQQTTSSSSSSSTTTTAALTAKDLLEKVQTAVQDKLTQSGSTAVTLSTSTSKPTYQVAQNSYSVSSSTGGYGFSAVLEDASDTSTLIADLVSTAQTTLASESSLTKSTNNYLTTYQNDTLLCTLSTDATVRCADKDSYKNQLDQIKPFATAFLASDQGKQNGSTTVFSDTLKVTEGTDGYSTATVNMAPTNSPVGGYVGLFYAKNDTWAFWKGAQDASLCSDYNTHDLQKAYESTDCYTTSSGNTLSKVTVTL